MIAYWASFAVAVVVVGAASFLYGRRRPSTRMRERLAAREEANGLGLLRLAAEIEAHAARLETAGIPARRRRAWVSLCRRATVQHLACINALLAEPGAGRELLGFGREREPPA